MVSSQQAVPDCYETTQQIYLSFTLGDEVVDISAVLNKEKRTADTLDIQGLKELFLEIANATFQDPNLLKLLQDPTEKFDAIIADLYEIEVYSG